ncbi:MAG: hypothetical protein ACI8YC_001042, partial [Salibacteraceae bacterium]
MSKNDTDSKRNSGQNLTEALLSKFQITELNPMQKEAYKTIQSKSDLILLSP